jgi:hypothetical protein
MKNFRFVLRLLTVCFVLKGYSQNPVNAYANVTAISGNSVLSVNNVNRTYDDFNNGDYIIIMQMQDNVIGTNTTNASSFGDIAAIKSAGLFEIARIASSTKVSGVVSSLTLNSPLTASYNINSNASVQVITFRNMGNNYSTSSNITALPWNGTIGGVIAMSVSAVFTLKDNISADVSGFRGGGKNGNMSVPPCDATTYISTVTTYYAEKGEGIYKATDPSFLLARGKITTGGGGANPDNSGGGGGGNYSEGGYGGIGLNFSTGCPSRTGGLGGLRMNSYISGSRIFMGGGGGGGHENNSQGTVGGAGGGIIIIKTGTLVTSSCTGVSISANGGSASDAGIDGAGAGGAGGTIWIQANAFNILGACPLTVSASGGNGGSTLHSQPHGGGGGGGEGAIIYSPAIPTTTSIVNTAAPGNGGSSCYTCTTNENASSGETKAGSVMTSAFPLPVELIEFKGYSDAYGNVYLNWKTAKEKDNRQFIVQRLGDNGISNIGTLAGKGDYNAYEWIDTQPGSGFFYYRLMQEDLDGTTTASQWIDISIQKESDIKVYPNPLTSTENLVIEIENTNFDLVQIEILNMEGIILYNREHSLQGGKCELDLSALPASAYILKLSLSKRNYYKKLIKGQ